MRRQVLLAIAAALVVVGGHRLLFSPRDAGPTEFAGHTPEEIAAGLDRVIPEVRFTNTRIDTAIECLARAAKTQITVDWTGLETACPFVRDGPVTMHARNISLSQAVGLLCGPSHADPVCVASGGAMRVEPANAARARGRCYDIEDLIDEAVNLDAQFGRPSKVPVAERRREAGAALVDILYVGRSPQGSSQYWSGRVLAIETPAGHRQIEERLRLLRTRSVTQARPSHDPLKQTVGPIHFEKMRPAEVLERLLNASGASFVVHWNELGRPEGLMNLTIAQPTALCDLLGEVLGRFETSPDTPTPDAWVEDGVIIVSSREASGRRTAVRIYDVRDLIAQTVWVEEPSGPSVTSCFREILPPYTASTPQEAGDQLLEFVTEAVTPEMWRYNGGPNVARHLAGRLVINAAPNQHEKIEELLGTLRETDSAEDRAWLEMVSKWQR